MEADQLQPTLRDALAAHAMQGFVTPAGPDNTWAKPADFEYIAAMAYQMADAMLKARAKAHT